MKRGGKKELGLPQRKGKDHERRKALLKDPERSMSSMMIIPQGSLLDTPQEAAGMYWGGFQEGPRYAKILLHDEPSKLLAQISRVVTAAKKTLVDLRQV